MGEVDDAVDGGVDGLKTVVDADDVGEPLQNKMKSSICQLSFCIWHNAVLFNNHFALYYI